MTICPRFVHVILNMWTKSSKPYIYQGKTRVDRFVDMKKNKCQHSKNAGIFRLLN